MSIIDIFTCGFWKQNNKAIPKGHQAVVVEQSRALVLQCSSHAQGLGVQIAVILKRFSFKNAEIKTQVYANGTFLTPQNHATSIFGTSAGIKAFCHLSFPFFYSFGMRKPNQHGKPHMNGKCCLPHVISKGGSSVPRNKKKQNIKDLKGYRKNKKT